MHIYLSMVRDLNLGMSLHLYICECKQGPPKALARLPICETGSFATGSDLVQPASLRCGP